MRPKIMTSHSIARSLTYNEEKVRIGKAECLTAANFLKDPSRLTPKDKLHCFERRMDLNERVSTSQHITLNFDPADKLSNDQMKKIAVQYMKDIGFGRQPYVVYRHYDAGHPHCHIVTTHIRRDGSPIELFNIGRNQSEKARQRIETEYGLITAEMKKQAWQERQKIDGIQRITYG
jgi:type IV secretory pathway VirD2 relaxase